MLHAAQEAINIARVPCMAINTQGYDQLAQRAVLGKL